MVSNRESGRHVLSDLGVGPVINAHNLTGLGGSLPRVTRSASSTLCNSIGLFTAIFPGQKGHFNALTPTHSHKPSVDPVQGLISTRTPPPNPTLGPAHHSPPRDIPGAGSPIQFSRT